MSRIRHDQLHRRSTDAVTHLSHRHHQSRGIRTYTERFGEKKS